MQCFIVKNCIAQPRLTPSPYYQTWPILSTQPILLHVVHITKPRPYYLTWPILPDPAHIRRPDPYLPPHLYSRPLPVNISPKYIRVQINIGTADSWMLVSRRINNKWPNKTGRLIGHTRLDVSSKSRFYYCSDPNRWMVLCHLGEHEASSNIHDKKRQ